MRPPVRVCCFCERWESGGIESFLHNVLCRLDTRRVEVDLVACCLKDSIFTAQMQERGIHFYELSGSSRKLFENYQCFQQLLKRRKYDVIHLNLFQGLSLYYARMAEKAGIPVRIAHSHNTALRNSRTKQLKLLIHHCAKELFAKDITDFWACSSPAAEFLFPRREAGGFTWIRNGIETERFRFDPAQRGKIREKLDLTDAFVIGNIGRLCDQKNQSFLLDIFREVVRFRPESRLLLIGEGDCKAALIRKAASMQLSDKTIFYGPATQPEELLWAMDVFVLPSRFEGLPVTAIEAQASGLPCVFSSNITEECKITEAVTFCDPAAGGKVWAELILNASCTVKERHGMADQVVAAGFDINALASDIQKFYERNSEP